MVRIKLLLEIVFFLIMLEVFFTAFLVFAPSSNSTICIFGSSCGDVQSSPYAYILGIKLSQIGLVSFIFLLGLFFLASKNIKYEFWFLLASFLGALFALYFLFIQFFILNQICSNCLIIDFIAIFICILSIFNFNSKT